MDKNRYDRRQKRREKQRLKRLRKLKILRFIIIVSLLLFVLLNTFIFSVVHVKGSSMADTLLPDNRILIRKIGLTSKSIKRGDIITFKGKDERPYIKRVIGLPGEFIQIIDGRIYVNGDILEEAYINTSVTETFGSDKWRLRDDEFFVLGDNRGKNDSKDSRIFGNVNISQIIGKMIFKF